MSNVNKLLTEIGALTPRTAELLTQQVREYLGSGNFLERHLNDPLTQAEVAQTDEVLLAFAAFVLDPPTAGGNDG